MQPPPPPPLPLSAYIFFMHILRRMGKNKAYAYHTCTYFHTCRVSIKLVCIRNPAGFLACPSVPVIAKARAVPTGGPRYYSGSLRCWTLPVYTYHCGVVISDLGAERGYQHQRRRHNLFNAISAARMTRNKQQRKRQVSKRASQHISTCRVNVIKH